MPQNATHGTKRIVLPEKVVQLAEEIQGVMGVSSIGEVFAILLTRYGSHLKYTWEFSSPLPTPYAPPSISRSLQVTHETQAEQDPAITRIAALLENF
jgi:hypothetical protein